MNTSLQSVFHQARRVALAWAGVMLIVAVVAGVALNSWHAQFTTHSAEASWFHVGEVVVGLLLVALTYLGVNRQARLNYAVAQRTRELREALQALEEDIVERRQAEGVAREWDAQLSSIFRAAPIGIGLLVDRIIQEANDMLCQMTGYPREELLWQNSRLLYPTTDEYDRVGRVKYGHIAEHGVGTVETRWRRKDGSILPVLLSSAPLDPTNLAQGVTFTALDITERTRSEAAEREQYRLAEALRNTAAALNSTLNFDEVLDRILVSMERVIVYDAADILLLNDTRTIAQVARHRSHIEPDNTAAVMQLQIPVAQSRNLREMLAGGQPVIIDDVRAETEWVANPASAWIRSNLGFPIIVHGQTIGVLSVDQARPDAFTATDADRLRAFADQVALAIQNAQLHEHVQRYADELELRIAERTKDLAAANERLQELDRLKTKFVSDVSHELRTPVTGLGLYLDLMNRGKPENRALYLQHATTQMARLRGLIDDILDLSRLDRQHQGWNSELLDLNEVAALVVDEQQLVAEAAGLELSSQRTVQPLRVLGDHSQMLRAIRNLVANAIKYTRAGQVQVTMLEKGAWVGVQVTDTGIGIASEDLPHIFERFYRGQQVAQSTIPGTGLGLAIVKEIIEAHGGTVEVKSELGVGSTFRLWLPAMIG